MLFRDKGAAVLLTFIRSLWAVPDTIAGAARATTGDDDARLHATPRCAARTSVEHAPAATAGQARQWNRDAAWHEPRNLEAPRKG